MRRILFVLPLAAVLLIAGAGLAYVLGHGPSIASGRPTVAFGGQELVSGGQGLPPQPTLDVSLPKGRQASDYQAQLDGRPLPLSSRGGGASLQLPAQAQGSKHRLEIWHPGLGGHHDDVVQIDFGIVEPLQVAVSWLTAPGSARATITWSRQPADTSALKAQLQAAGASVGGDSESLVATWAGVGAGQHLGFTIPAGAAATDGGFLPSKFDASGTVGGAAGAVVQLSKPPAQDTSGLKLQMYFVPTTEARADLARHARQVSVLSPSFYSLDGAGALQGNVDTQALAIASQAGVEVDPLVTNTDFDRAQGHDLLNNPALYSNVASQLIAEARANAYSGYQLDFENLAPGDRDALSQFSADLGGRLKAAGLNWSLAVIPRRATSSPGGQSAVYDYSALAGGARWLTMMAYDEHTRQEDPGPVAGIDWVRELIGFSTSRLDTSRAYLGVPLYSRDFSLSGAPVARSYGDTIAFAAQNGGSISWRFDIATVRAEYVADGVQHVAWLDGASSLAAKAALAREYHLGGVAAWRLGFEDPEFWSLWPNR